MIFSAFPILLNYYFYAPMILRVLVGVVFFGFGIEIVQRGFDQKKSLFEDMRLRSPHIFVYLLAATEIAGGVMLIAGFLTQIVALVLMVICITAAIINKRPNDYILRDNLVYILLIFILISIILTGPGHAAVDLPL